MQASTRREKEVLIVGAGPTGLVLALWLTRLGVRIRIIDKSAEPGTTSRAVAVQARTLEFYRQIGIADAVVEAGRKTIAGNMWVAGRQVARAVIGDFGRGISPFPYVLVYPQDEHERLLIDRLAEAGFAVERQTELVGFEQAADGSVLARLKGPEGAEQSCTVSYLAGCDGARSAVREGLGIAFPGGTYEHMFYVADAEAQGQTMNGELHVALDRSDFLVIFPMQSEGRARLIGTVRDELEAQHETLTWDDVSTRVMDWVPIHVERVNWFSTYRVHHRVADHFRKGSAFLLGDAAHIHSPVGGQGMNTGIGDAVNLAWKLAAVLQGRANASLLDTYETERIAFARRLVTTTDRAFTNVISSNALARLIRLHLVPLLVPHLFRFSATKRLMFRLISQTAIRYLQSSLSEGRAGTIRGGDRLPWVSKEISGGDEDNFAPLASLDWQVHVYGDDKPEFRAACAERQLPLHVFAWHPAMTRAGLMRNAAYLVRPDGYVALAIADGSGGAIASYLDARGLGSRQVGTSDID